MNLKDYIREVPNFPKPGILFRDITPLIGEPAAFSTVIDEMTALARAQKVDTVAAIESRGFIFGAPVAARLQLPFVPIRKPGKLPSKLRSVEYSLEYGSGRLDMHEDALRSGARVALIDDLLATGGTAAGAATLIKESGGTVAICLFLIELTALEGRALLGSAPVQALISY